LSPFYDKDKNSIFYVDAIASFVFKPVIFRYDITKNVTYSAWLQGLPLFTKLGFIISFKDTTDLFSMNAGRDLVVVRWDGVSPMAKIICRQFEIEPIKTNFVHSAHADPKDRLWMESLRNKMCDKNSTTPPGRIFMSEDGKTVKPVIENLTIANDFYFDAIGNMMVFGDSCPRQIKAVDYDPKTGKVSNTRVVYDDTNSPYATPITAPDGVVIDIKRNFWITGNGQGVVYYFDTKIGNRTHIIKIPSKFAQAVTFGGPNYDELYVTTDAARYDVRTGKIETFQGDEEDGYLYKISGLRVEGQPESKLGTKYASCMNDPAALEEERQRQSLLGTVEEDGDAIAQFLKYQPYL